jgi:hypothetical protein
VLLGTWGTYWELDGNPLGTWWEHIGTGTTISFKFLKVEGVFFWIDVRTTKVYLLCNLNPCYNLTLLTGSIAWAVLSICYCAKFDNLGTKVLMKKGIIPFPTILGHFNTPSEVLGWGAAAPCFLHKHLYFGFWTCAPKRIPSRIYTHPFEKLWL